MVTAIVIDDDLDVRETLAEFLRIKDVEVIGIGKDGKDALDLYQMHGPDVVIMDIMMPGYDGMYGLREIRRWDKDAKIIMISALATQTIYDLYDKGASAVLKKPYDIDEVMQVISQVQRVSR